MATVREMALTADLVVRTMRLVEDAGPGPGAVYMTDEDYDVATFSHTCQPVMFGSLAMAHCSGSRHVNLPNGGSPQFGDGIGRFAIEWLAFGAPETSQD